MFFLDLPKVLLFQRRPIGSQMIKDVPRAFSLGFGPKGILNSASMNAVLWIF